MLLGALTEHLNHVALLRVLHGQHLHAIFKPLIPFAEPLDAFPGPLELELQRAEWFFIPSLASLKPVHFGVQPCDRIPFDLERFHSLFEPLVLELLRFQRLAILVVHPVLGHLSLQTLHTELKPAAVQAVVLCFELLQFGPPAILVT